MKKVLTITLLIGIAWVIYAYLSSALERERFILEVDSLLASPRGITERNLPQLILNKARQTGIQIDPEAIEVTITGTGRETTTSRLFAKKGFVTHTRVLTVRFHYKQSFLGKLRIHDYERERTFTAQVAPSTSQASEIDEVFSK